MTYYIGQNPGDVLGDTARYFYGVRRTDQGELFLVRSDQLLDSDSISINRSGESSENFPNFNEGVDFFEGRTIEHTLIYDNLVYEQFKWDNKSVYYYVNSNGELVLSISKKPTYNETDSSEGIE